MVLKAMVHGRKKPRKQILAPCFVDLKFKVRSKTHKAWVCFLSSEASNGLSIGQKSAHWGHDPPEDTSPKCDQKRQSSLAIESSLLTTAPESDTLPFSRTWGNWVGLPRLQTWSHGLPIAFCRRVSSRALRLCARPISSSPN